MRHFMTALTMLALLTAGLVLVGCGGGDKERAEKPSEAATLEQIAGKEWVLRWWDRQEPALLTEEVTLSYVDGQFVGSNGCNNYFWGVEAGSGPGEITVSIGGATKKFCPDPAGEVEMRYARLLQAVNHIAIKGGELELSYEFEGKEGAMIFKAREIEETE